MQLNNHPRASIVEEARHEFAVFMLSLQQKYDLTYGEMFSMLGKKIADLAMYQIRHERHPNDPGKGGDDA